MPACGTVACLAGWGAVLLRPDRTSAVSLHEHAEDVFEQLLGYEWGSSRSVYGLFSSCVTSYDAATYNSRDRRLPPAGTPEHAEVIAQRIDTYMQRHPEILSRKIDVAKARKALR